ncbi:hypothetical protein NDU88_001031 [Pleurodeles waltl]|uniref:Uncharacterized protein n=1 Tax=Pleurodeles waltl TaxID=8319 RepID=A0AAV7SYV3_PLEWA|nr:hypothetical protein NDU88_001031 [Pleurodeles waltl]
MLVYAVYCSQLSGRKTSIRSWHILGMGEKTFLIAQQRRSLTGGQRISQPQVLQVLSWVADRLRKRLCFYQEFILADTADTASQAQDYSGRQKGARYSVLLCSADPPSGAACRPHFSPCGVGEREQG